MDLSPSRGGGGGGGRRARAYGAHGKEGRRQARRRERSAAAAAMQQLQQQQRGAGGGPGGGGIRGAGSGSSLEALGSSVLTAGAAAAAESSVVPNTCSKKGRTKSKPSRRQEQADDEASIENEDQQSSSSSEGEEEGGGNDIGSDNETEDERKIGGVEEEEEEEEEVSSDDDESPVVDRKTKSRRQYARGDKKRTIDDIDDDEDNTSDVQEEVEEGDSFAALGGVLAGAPPSPPKLGRRRSRSSKSKTDNDDGRDDSQSQSSTVVSEEVLTGPDSVGVLTQDSATRASAAAAIVGGASVGESTSTSKKQKRRESPYSAMKRSSDLESLAVDQNGRANDSDSDEDYEEDEDDDEEEEEESAGIVAGHRLRVAVGSRTTRSRRQQQQRQQQQYQMEDGDTDNDEENEFVDFEEEQGDDDDDTVAEVEERTPPRGARGRGSSGGRKRKGSKKSAPTNDAADVGAADVPARNDANNSEAAGPIDGDYHDDTGAGVVAAKTTPKVANNSKGKSNDVTPKVDNRSLTQQGRQSLLKKKRRKKKTTIVPTVLPAAPRVGDTDVNDSLTFQSQTIDTTVVRRSSRTGRNVKKRDRTVVKTTKAATTKTTRCHSRGAAADNAGSKPISDGKDPFLEQDPSLEVEDEVEEFQDTPGDIIVDSGDEKERNDATATTGTDAMETEFAQDEEDLVERDTRRTQLATSGGASARRRRRKRLAAGPSALEATPQRQETVKWSEDVKSTGRTGKRNRKDRDSGDVDGEHGINGDKADFSSKASTSKSRASNVSVDSILISHGQAGEGKSDDGGGGVGFDLADNEQEQQLATQPPQDDGEGILSSSSEDSDGNDDDSSCKTSQEERAQKKKRRKIDAVDDDNAKGTARNGKSTASRKPSVSTAECDKSKAAKTSTTKRAERNPGTKTKAQDKALSKESKAIMQSINRLEALCEDFTILSQDEAMQADLASKCLRQQAAEFQKLSSLSSSLARDAFEGAMKTVVEHDKVIATLAASLRFALRLANSTNVSPTEGKRRTKELCTCLRFFLDASDLIGVFNAFSRRDSSPVFSRSAQLVLSDPDVVSQLLKTVREAWTTNRSKVGKEEKQLRAEACTLANACLCAVDPRRVDNYISSDESTDCISVIEDLHRAAASLHKIGSYPEMELILLFLVRFRRSLLLASLDDKSGVTKGTLKRFDFAFSANFRDKLSDLNMHLPSAVAGGLLVGQEGKLSFCDWARQCIKSGTQCVVPFDCISVFNPQNDHELGTRITHVPSIHINASTLSFYVIDPSADDDATRRTIESSFTGESSEDSISSPRDSLAVEDLYGRTKLVQTHFDDWRNSDGQVVKTPIAYSSERGVITIHLSPEGRMESNLAEVVKSEDDVGNLTADTSASAAEKGVLQFLDCAENHQSNILRLQVKKDEYQAFHKALEDRGVLVLEQDGGDHACRSLDGTETHEEEAIEFQRREASNGDADGEGMMRDHVEFSTRRIRPARAHDAQSAHSTAQHARSGNSFESAEQGDGSSIATMRANTEVAEIRGGENIAMTSAVSADTPVGPAEPPKNAKKKKSSSRERSKPSKEKMAQQGANSTISSVVKRKRGDRNDNDEDGEFDPDTSCGCAPDSQGAHEARRKHMKVDTKDTIHDARKKPTREVTPLPQPGGLVHKQTSTSPCRSAVASQNDLSQYLDTRFQTVESNSNTLESISARCCALLAVGGAPGQENELKLELPLPLSQIDGGNDLAEDVIAYDEALLRAVDALNTVNRLALRIENACESTKKSTADTEAAAAAEASESSAFGWIGRPYEQVRLHQQKWASQRKEVEKQLHNILLQELTLHDRKKQKSSNA